MITFTRCLWDRIWSTNHCLESPVISVVANQSFWWVCAPRSDDARLLEFQTKADRLPWLLYLPQKNRENLLGSKQNNPSPRMGWNPCLSLTGNPVFDEDPCKETANASFQESQGAGCLRVRWRYREPATDLSERSLPVGWRQWPWHCDSQWPFNIQLSLVGNSATKIPVIPSPMLTPMPPQRRCAVEQKA